MTKFEEILWGAMFIGLIVGAPITMLAEEGVNLPPAIAMLGLAGLLLLAGTFIIMTIWFSIGMIAWMLWMNKNDLWPL